MSLRPGDLLVIDPEAVNDPMGMDWTAWLAEIAPTELIVNSTWSYTGPDAAITLSSSSIVTGSKQTQVKRTGGTLGAKYVLTNHVTSTSGSQDDRSIELLVQSL